MPPFDNIIAVILAGALLSITPGPSMLYVLSRSVGQSRAAGLASALGLALGGVVLAIATALGLAGLFTQFPVLVEVLRYGGSAYLVWLGVTMALSSRAEAARDLQVSNVPQNAFSTIIWQGVLVEMMNPKTVLFFALFLPPFVHVSGETTAAANVQTQLLVLGILVPLTAIPSDAVIAFLGGTLTKTLNQQHKFREWLGWVGGSILVLIAVNLHIGLI